MSEKIFQIINFDGFNVGLTDSFVSTFLEFEDLDLAIEIARHWRDWVNGDDT